MSYDKNIGNQEVKFKDEKSYLNCRLDYLIYCEERDFPVGLEPTFLVFIEAEMYRENTCEVESIELIQYTGAGSIDFNTSTFTSTSPIGFALGGGDQTVAVGGSGGDFQFAGGSGGSYGSYTDTSGDFHITGNLVVDGTINVVGGASFASGSLLVGQGNAVSEISVTPPVPELQKEPPKEEPPIDPIESRFDILDL